MSDIKVLGPDIGYVELLDYYTQNKLDEDKNKSWGMPLRPSSAGKCARQLAYELMESLGKSSYEKEAKKPNVDRLLKLGYLVENHLISQFQVVPDLKIKYKQQTVSLFSLSDGTIVEGHIDSGFELGGFRGLIDYKSKKDKFSKFYSTDWIETNLKLKDMTHEFGSNCFWIEDLDTFLDAIKEKDPFLAMNFYQLNLYFFDSASFLRNRGYDHSALIYYNKNDSTTREIRFKPSETVFNGVKDKFNLIYDTIKVQNKSPEEVPRSFLLGNVSCAFCDYKKDCWGEDVDTQKEYFKTLDSKWWPKDTDRLGDTGIELEDLFAKWKVLENAVEEKNKIEKSIIKIMVENKIPKIRFANGEIYFNKKLKDSIEFRRTKL